MRSRRPATLSPGLRPGLAIANHQERTVNRCQVHHRSASVVRRVLCIHRQMVLTTRRPCSSRPRPSRTSAAGSSISSSWTRWARPICWPTAWACRWPTRRRRVDAAGRGQVSRLGPHARLGRHLESPRRAGQVPGARRRQAAGRRPSARKGPSGTGRTAARSKSRRRKRHAGPARPDRLRGPLRRDPLDRRPRTSRRPTPTRRWPPSAASCWGCRRNRRTAASSTWSWSAAASPARARPFPPRGSA